MLGLIGRKVGMSRFFNPEGVSLPVTIIQVTHNRVVQIKRKAKEGYDAVQLTFGSAQCRYTKPEALEQGLIEPGQRLPKRSKFIKLPQKGHFVAHGCEPGRHIREFPVSEEELAWLEGHRAFGLELFEKCPSVDVTGESKGKGFAGVIKRWNFRSQPASHGNSLSHRAPGSIGQNQTPGRVFKGKKMAGHLGCERVTLQGLEVVHMDLERSLLLVKGAVPGASGGLVLIRPSKKSLRAQQSV